LEQQRGEKSTLRVVQGEIFCWREAMIPLRLLLSYSLIVAALLLGSSATAFVLAPSSSTTTAITVSSSGFQHGKHNRRAEEAIISPRRRRTQWSSSSSSFQVNMVKFNGEKWVAEKPDETDETGYPVLNTLFLHGPKPFFTRVFQPNDYEQVRTIYGSSSISGGALSSHLIKNRSVVDIPE
jgi:hypothetical protein